MIGYHFIRKDKRLGYDDGRIVRVGRTYKVKCEPILCQQGLHACKRPLDALSYAPGPIVCKVGLGGTIVHGDDKSVATERTVLAMADATETLGKFGRMCALDVTHLWDAPDVVVKYLKTGDESLRAAAWAAAWDAAWDAAWAAARDAAWAAARDAAWAAARAAARDAAWDAARAAARAAAWDAAWAAAREKQNRRLARMLGQLLRKDGEK